MCHKPFKPPHPTLGALALLALWLGGCAATPERPPAHQATPARSAPLPAEHDRQKVVRSALAALGTPYRYGGNGPGGFDCSGLVQYSYAAAGIRVPRVTTEQRRHARPVSLSRLKPGDLLFFQLAGKGRHVAIYLGDGQFIHAPSTGKRVSLGSLAQPYWRNHLVAAGSYL